MLSAFKNGLWSSMMVVVLALGSKAAAAPPVGSDNSLPSSLPIPRNVVPRAVRDDVAALGRSSAAVASNEVGSLDDFLTFCVDFDGLPEKLATSRDYRVVAVTGCQCSGKSTLLNALFGTG